MVGHSQKSIIKEVSTKVVRYANEGIYAENIVKPYYLYRLTTKNEFKEYLIGFNVTLVKYPGAKAKSNQGRALGYDRVKNLVTRSRRQINEGNLLGYKSDHIPLPILGEKINGKWEVFIKDDTPLVSLYSSASAIEGEVYYDSVWLQSEDKEYALELLIKNKISSVDKLQRQIDLQNEKIDTLEKIYNEIKGKKE